LRLEHKAGPAGRVLGDLLAWSQKQALGHSYAMAAQQGFSLDLGKTHNPGFLFSKARGF